MPQPENPSAFRLKPEKAQELIVIGENNCRADGGEKKKECKSADAEKEQPGCCEAKPKAPKIVADAVKKVHVLFTDMVADKCCLTTETDADSFLHASTMVSTG